ncbi:unnamed protein product [Lupinus luteus]|uniref:Uncharacterized protein n=1 Tax=Lupinus luteus TaxID=3873 RepID=A0AAV1W9C6_LUPLU
MGMPRSGKKVGQPSERVLPILNNLVSTPEGRKTINAMLGCIITPSVDPFGRPVGAEKSLKDIGMFMDKGKQVPGSYSRNFSASVSATICGSSSSFAKTEGRSLEDEDMMSEEKKPVKQLVQQTHRVCRTHEENCKRANLRQDFIPSEHFPHPLQVQLGRACHFKEL